MILLGVDPGIAKCGLGAVQKTDGGYEVVRYKEVTTHPYFTAKEKASGRVERPEHERFGKIAQEFLSMIKGLRVAAVGIEQVFFTPKNKSSAMRVAQVIGMIKYLCHENNLPYYEFRPNDVKQAVGAEGSGKKEVIEKVESITGKRFKSNHVADAIAVAITYGKYAKTS